MITDPIFVALMSNSPRGSCGEYLRSDISRSSHLGFGFGFLVMPYLVTIVGSIWFSYWETWLIVNWIFHMWPCAFWVVQLQLAYMNSSIALHVHFSDNIVKHQCYPWGTFSNQWDGRKPPMWTRRRAFPRLSLPNPKSAPQYQVCGPLPALACQPPWKEVCLTHVVGKCKSETFQQCTTFQLCPTTSPFLSKMMYQRCLAWHVNTVFGLN